MLPLLLSLACSGGDDAATVPGDTPSTDNADADADADSDADSDTDADSDETGATDTGFGSPSRLEVTCAPTANLLRYDCAVTVEPAQPVRLTWARTDGLSIERIRTSEAVATTHAFSVLFLAPNREYQVQADAAAWPAAPVATTRFTVGPMPPAAGAWLDIDGTSTLGLIGTETPCSTDAIAVVFDTATGDLVWYEDLDPPGQLGVLDMVRFTDERTVIGETGPRIVEIDLQGNDIARFPVSYPGCCGLNHDIFRHDGEYWSQYQDIRGPLTLDNIVVIDATGVEVWRWEPEDHLSIPPAAWGDWLHTNSEWVDANGDFYLSWLTRDAVAKFVGDRTLPNAGQRLWVMTGDGRPGELGNDITLDWSGISLPHEFGGQHNFHGTRDGRLMLLDNDHGRGLVFTIDESTLTGTVDAEFPTRERSCGPQGTAMDTVAGGAVVACASPWVREYDAAGTLLWEAEIICPRGGGGGWTPNAATRWYPLDTWE